MNLLKSVFVVAIFWMVMGVVSIAEASDKPQNCQNSSANNHDNSLNSDTNPKSESQKQRPKRRRSSKGARETR